MARPIPGKGRTLPASGAQTFVAGYVLQYQGFDSRQRQEIFFQHICNVPFTHPILNRIPDWR
jgi:hypothetical protein